MIEQVAAETVQSNRHKAYNESMNNNDSAAGRTASWGANPWPRNSQDRCPNQVREKARRGEGWAFPARKGRCMKAAGHEGPCSLHAPEENGDPNDAFDLP